MVVIAHYNIRACLTLTITLLTAKTVLMTLFILRFDCMTGAAIVAKGVKIAPTNFPPKKISTKKARFTTFSSASSNGAHWSF